MNVVTKIKPATSKGRVYRGESHTARAQERHKKLIAAAAEIIGSNGLKSATVRKVCAQAGLTERYYYEAFKNAHDMLKQVYLAQINKLADTMLGAILSVDQTPAPMAEAALTSLFGAMKKDPRMARIIYLEIVGVSDELDEVYRDGLKKFEDLLVRFSHPLYPEENVADLDEPLIASALVGAVTQVARNWVIADFDRSITSLVHNLMNLVLGVTYHFQTRTPAR